MIGWCIAPDQVIFCNTIKQFKINKCNSVLMNMTVSMYYISFILSVIGFHSVLSILSIQHKAVPAKTRATPK